MSLSVGVSSSIKIAVTYLVLVTVASIYAFESLLIVGGYLILSAVTFLLYAKDKRSAVQGSWRVKENTLHLFSLFGGWLGALIAQEHLRHKTQKQPFRAIFWCTVVLNVGVFVCGLTPQGQSVFQAAQAEVMSFF